MKNNPLHCSLPALVALLFLAPLCLSGCASSNECYTETGFIDVYADQQETSPDDENYDPFADDPFEDDPFADDPFEDDPFEDDYRWDSASGAPPEADNNGCPIPPEEEEEEDDVLDPIEPINRGIFWVNDKLYTFVLKPVARTYRFAIPQPARQGIGNFFSNLLSPVRALNSFLQLKFTDAAEEVSRFAINSTVGVLGFIDVAGQNGLKSKKEDMGQTFGRYGVGHGIYLVLPFFGPSSIRDAVGKVGDLMIDPSVWAVETDTWTRLGFTATSTINTISLDKDTYEALIKQSLDPYATMRSGYIQMRKAKVER